MGKAQYGFFNILELERLSALVACFLRPSRILSIVLRTKARCGWMDPGGLFVPAVLKQNFQRERCVIGYKLTGFSGSDLNQRVTVSPKGAAL
jgi:hypothetical protein